MLDQTADQLKVALIGKRLESAAKDKNELAVIRGIANAVSRYGEELTQKAVSILFIDHPWLLSSLVNKLPVDKKNLLYEKTNEMIADSLTEAGLRLEDHLRVSDNGLALTKEAIAVIGASGFSRVDAFNEGNDSLEGFGLDRDLWWHPLSEFSEDKEWMNCWAMSSFFISCALGWMPGEGELAKSIKIVKDTVFPVAPNVDVAGLMRQARYDDRALLKLTELVHRGFESKMEVKA